MAASRAKHLGLLVAGAIAAMASQGADARVVGVVFDDSGSMASRIHLPTFGVQMLASTLDVRSGRDRLLTLRLSKTGAGVVEENIASIDGLQRTVDEIRRSWARVAGGTPYAPIELMLQAMVQKLRPEETGTLFVLTDGQIDRPPAVADMQRTFEALKRELDAKRASINVEFMLIAVGPDRERVRQAVRSQMVRATLLEQFNGDQRDPNGAAVGEHEVVDIRELFDIMKKIIARISGTDVSRIGNYVGYAGNTVTVNTPVSVARMVSIAKAINAEPPAVARRSFDPSRPFVIGSRMTEADRALPNQLFRATTEQTVFQPALPAGQHSIVFSGSVAEDVFLIFETNARVELSILGADGVEARRDSAGAYVLVRNRDYRLAEILVDETSEGRRVVPLSTLGGQPRFTATIDEPGGARQTLSLAVVPAENRAISTFRPGKVGALIARGRVQLDGFVSSVSNAVQINVIEGTLKINATIKPTEPCPDCAAGEFRSIIGPAGADVSVATIDLVPEGDIPGTANLDLSGLPAGLSLVNQNGEPVVDGTRLEIAPNRPLQFRTVRAARPPAELIGKPVRFTVRLRGDQTIGDHALEGLLSVIAPVAKLTYLGATGATNEAGRVTVTGADVVGANVKLNFKVEDALDPVVATQFRVESRSWFTTVDWTVSDNSLTATPRASYWCMCFLWLDRGVHDVEVSYVSLDRLQKAETKAPFEIAPTWSEILFGCLLLLGLLIAFAWAVGVIVNAWTAKRFPRDSFMEIDEGQQLPRHVTMRGRNWTFLRALFWPILGRPDERRVLEGLDLAAGHRLNLRVGRESEDLNIRGEWVSERFSLNEKLERLMLQLNWQEAIQKKGPPTISIRCWKSAGDRNRGY
jgi:hypothetical protein